MQLACKLGHTATCQSPCLNVTLPLPLPVSPSRCSLPPLPPSIIPHPLPSAPPCPLSPPTHCRLILQYRRKDRKTDTVHCPVFLLKPLLIRYLSFDRSFGDSTGNNRCILYKIVAIALCPASAVCVSPCTNTRSACGCIFQILCVFLPMRCKAERRSHCGRLHTHPGFQFR